MTTPTERRAYILAYLSEHPGTHAAVVIAFAASAHFGVPIYKRTVCEDAQRLVVRGEVERDGAARFRLAAGAAKKRLPVVGHMKPGFGDRDDTCGRYMQCLTGAERLPMAYCPNGCPHYEPTPRERATDYMGRTDAPDASVYAGER